MQDAQDEPLFVQRVAGLDIAKAGVEVTIRVPSDTARAAASKKPVPLPRPGPGCCRWRTGCAAGA